MFFSIIWGLDELCTQKKVGESSLSSRAGEGWTLLFASKATWDALSDRVVLNSPSPSLVALRVKMGSDSLDYQQHSVWFGLGAGTPSCVTAFQPFHHQPHLWELIILALKVWVVFRLAIFTWRKLCRPGKVAAAWWHAHIERYWDFAELKALSEWFSPKTPSQPEELHRTLLKNPIENPSISILTLLYHLQRCLVEALLRCGSCRAHAVPASPVLHVPPANDHCSICQLTW